MWEWTSENFSTLRVFRGGNVDHNSKDYPVSCRSNTSVSDMGYDLGFRVVLYI